MHDIKAIRQNPALFDQELGRRGLPPVSEVMLKMDAENRAGQTSTQELQAKSNALAKQIGEVKRTGGDASALLAESAKLKQQLADAKAAAEGGEVSPANSALNNLLCTLPNLLAADVPYGTDESGNKEVKKHGTPRTFAFAPKQHFELGEALGLMDFDQTAKISGARFVTLTGALARLERALGQFMLDVHTREHGYREVSPPTLVRDDALFGTSQLPNLEEDLFKTGTGHYLIPTSEVPLTNLVRERIVEDEQLPMRYTALTPCYRSEAGSAGKDTRGMIRQHQFWKVEMVSITTPEQSEAEHERMRESAEEILKRLELPYRVMLLCSGDTGFASRKTYDLEVWLPGQDAYREISSCSNCGEFQARRMNARTRPKGAKELRFVHTLNGSGVAVGRALIAVLENYQQADGSILIPKALVPYMDGVTHITKDGVQKAA